MYKIPSPMPSLKDVRFIAIVYFVDNSLEVLGERNRNCREEAVGITSRNRHTVNMVPLYKSAYFPPASMRSTETFGSSESLLANTAPAAPGRDKMGQGVI
jgi:hypothetical protein